eukprot:scaffold363_cov56-Cylindrotheca_fusiformis.AAC.24
MTEVCPLSPALFSPRPSQMVDMCPFSPALPTRSLSQMSIDSEVSDLSDYSDDDDYSENSFYEDDLYMDDDDDDDETAVITLTEDLRLPLRTIRETYMATSAGEIVEVCCTKCQLTYYAVEDVSHIICGECWGILRPEIQTARQAMLIAERGPSVVFGVTDEDIADWCSKNW